MNRLIKHSDLWLEKCHALSLSSCQTIASKLVFSVLRAVRAATGLLSCCHTWASSVFDPIIWQCIQLKCGTASRTPSTDHHRWDTHEHTLPFSNLNSSKPPWTPRDILFHCAIFLLISRFTFSGLNFQSCQPLLFVVLSFSV